LLKRHNKKLALSYSGHKELLRKKKRAEEVIACPKSIKKEPEKPNKFWLKKPKTAKFIWAIELYAIIFLISIWLRAIQEEKKSPIKAIT